MTMQALNIDKKVALWLLFWCSMLLAPLAARADVVTERNMTAIRAAQASVISQLPVKLRTAAEHNAVRPFRINVPEEALVDLRRRIAATRWPDKEMVADQSQGVPLAMVREEERFIS
jgi:hypothetical protein